MEAIIDFLLNYVLAVVTGLAVIAVIRDLIHDKPQAIPAAICFAIVYFRMPIQWWASEGGTVPLVVYSQTHPVAGFVSSPLFKSALLVSTIFSCVYWLEHTRFKKLFLFLK